MPRSKKYFSNKSGFTLIELAIAVAIIGALATISTTIINPKKQQQRASDAVILSALIKSKLSAETFISSYGRYPNEKEFFESLSGEPSQKDHSSCEVMGAPDNECLYNISGVDTPISCDEDGWFGDKTDTNKCFFRYKGGIDGQKDRFRISVKTHGLINHLFVFDNKLAGNVYKCPWPHTDNKDFEDCVRFDINKIDQDGSGDGTGGFLGGIFGGGDDEDEEEFLDLQLTSVCSNDPDATRRWRVKNENTFEVPVYWNVVGTMQAGDFVAPKAGEGVPSYEGSDENNYTFFETTTVEGSNTTKIWWYDNDMQKYETVKASGGVKCEEPITCDQSGLEITTDVLPKAEWYQLYTTTLTGAGGEKPYLWNILWEESSLPGNFIIGQYDGKLSGIPKAGTDIDYPLWIKLTDDNSCSVDKYFNFSVDNMYDCSKSDISITTTSIPEATSKETYTTQIEASGGIRPYTWEIVKYQTTVPGYLTIDQSTGVITGTPEGDAGTYTLVVRVKDSGNCKVTSRFSLSLKDNVVYEGDFLIVKGRFVDSRSGNAILGARYIKEFDPYNWGENVVNNNDDGTFYIKTETNDVNNQYRCVNWPRPPDTPFEELPKQKGKHYRIEHDCYNGQKYHYTIWKDVEGKYGAVGQYVLIFDGERDVIPFVSDTIDLGDIELIPAMRIEIRADEESEFLDRPFIYYKSIPTYKGTLQNPNRYSKDVWFFFCRNEYRAYLRSELWESDGAILLLDKSGGELFKEFRNGVDQEEIIDIPKVGSPQDCNSKMIINVENGDFNFSIE